MDEPSLSETSDHPEPSLKFLVPLSTRSVPVASVIPGRCFVCDAKLSVTNRLGRCSSHKPSLSADIVKKMVANKFGVTVKDLEDPCRRREFVIPRQIAMAILRGGSTTLRSYPAIGRLLGNRDHTTVMHGTQRIREVVRNNPKLARTIMELLEELPKLPTMFLGQEVPPELPQMSETQLGLSFVLQADVDAHPASRIDHNATVIEEVA